MIISEEYLDKIRVPLYENFELSHFDSEEEYDLFISHSYLDKHKVQSLYWLFKQYGIKAYIDWIEDKQLDRNSVTIKTAELLRDRISQCKGLAYIDTENTRISKWCPWELGVADGLLGKVCILPIAKNIGQQSYFGQEYLGLYPYIDFGHTKNEERDRLWINDHKGFDDLKNWLNEYQ